MVKSYEPHKCEHLQALALWDALVVLILRFEGSGGFCLGVGMVFVKQVSFEATLARCKSLLYYILAAQFWANYSSSLGFCFIMYKIGIIIIFTLRSTWICDEGYMS